MNNLYYVYERINFLTTSFRESGSNILSEPFAHDQAYYYMIMNKKTNNVISVLDQSIVENASLVSWEPQLDNDSQLFDIIPVGNDLYQFRNKNSELLITSNGFANGLKQKSDIKSDAQKWKLYQ